MTEKKSTHELLEDMKKSGNYKEFYLLHQNELIDKNKMKVSRALTAKLAEKKLEKKDVVKRSCLMEKYAYQIFSGKKDNPSRDKVLALCIAMHLTLEEVQQLLKVTGYAVLYPKDKRDSIIIVGINNKNDVININSDLYDYNCDPIE